MADTSVDKLKIEIDASAKNAGDAIDKLIENIGRLREATGMIETDKLTELSNSISNLSKSMKEMPKGSAFTSLAKGIEKISKIDTSGISAVTGSINELASSVAALNASGITDVSFNVHTDGMTASDATARAQEQLVNVNREVEQAMEETADAAQEESQAQNQLGESSVTLRQRLRALLGNLGELRTRIAGIGSSLKNSGVRGFAALGSEIRRVSSAVNKVSAKTGGFIKRIAGLVARFTPLNKALRTTRSLLERTSKSFDKTNKKAGSFERTLKGTLGLYGFAVLYAGITASMESLGTAIEHLARKSAGFNQSFSALVSAMSTFSHQIAALAQPLLNIFGPALVTIINLMSTALSYVNQFLSALTGKKFFTSAKQQNKDYAASLDDVGSSASKAAEEIRDATVGIDELNIISQNNDLGGGGGGGAVEDLEDCYEELEINQKILDLVQKLKDTLTELFQPMKQAWDDYGKDVLNSMEYALTSCKNLIVDMAKTWKNVWLNGSGYELCSNILILLKEIFMWIGDIATAWDGAWNNKGEAYVQSIFDLLNSILSLIGTVSLSFRTAFNGGSGQEAIEHIYQILTDCNNVVTNLATNFKNAWKEAGIGDGIAQALFDIFNSILQTIEDISGSLAEWAEKLNFEPLLSAFKELLEAIKPIVDDIGAAFEWLFTDILEPGVTWIIEQGLPGALETIAGALETLHNILTQIDPEVLKGIGKALLVIAGASKAVDVIAGIVQKITALWTTIKSIGIVAKIGEMISLVVGGAGTMSEAFAVCFPKIALIFGKIGAALSAIGSAIASAVTAIAGALNLPVAAVVAIIAAIAAAIAAIVIYWDEIKLFFSETIPNWWKNTVVPFFEGLPEWFAGVWEKVKTFCKEKWDALVVYLQGIPQKISDVVSKIGNWFAQLPGKIGYALGYALGKVVSWCVGIYNTLSEKIPQIIENVKTWFMELPGKIYDAIVGVKEKITSWAADVKAWFTEKATEIIESVKTFFSELPGKIYDAIIKVKEKITTWVSDVKAWCQEKIPEIIDNIVQFFKDIPSKLKELGTDIITGLIDGIKNAWENLKQGVSDFIDGFVQGFKDALGIHSPSTVFQEIGGFIVDGLIGGITDMLSACQEKVTTWAESVKEWFYGKSSTLKDKFTEYGSNIVTGFKDKVGNAYTTVKSNVTTWADKVKSWFNDSGFGGVNTATFTNYASNVIDGFKTRIGGYYSTVKTNITTWASKVKSWFTSDGEVNSTKFQAFATNVVDGFKNKIGNYYTVAKSNITTWGTKVVDWFKEKSGKSNWEGIASDVVDGFKNKIGSLYETCKGTIQSWGSSIISWFKEKLDINSPSKVFATLAENTVDGYAEGIENKGETTVKGPISTFAENIKKWFSDSSAGNINKDTWETYAGDIITAFGNKIGTAYTSIKDSVTTWAAKTKQWFSDSGFGGVNNSTWTTYAGNIITGFKDKVSNAYTTTKDSVTTWATKVRDWYTNSSFGSVNNATWTTYAGNIITGFKDKVSGFYTTTKDSMTTWANKVREWYTSSSFGGVNSTNFQTYANNIITGFKTKVSNTYTTVQSSITTWANKVREWYTSSSFGGVNSTNFTTYAGNIIDGFKTKIGNYYTTVQSNMTTWAGKVKEWFTSSSFGGVNNSDFQTFAANAVDGFKSKIGSYYTTVQSNMSTFGSYVITTFKNAGAKYGDDNSGFYSVAKDVVNGFKNGIGDLYTTCKNTISSWGASIISWFKEKLDVNSPSKIFETIGGYTVDGFNKGIGDNARSTMSYMNEWIGSFSDFKANIGVKFNIQESMDDLSKYKANLDTGLSADTIVRTVKETVNTDGIVRASVEGSGSFKEIIREVIEETITGKLDNIADSTKRQADKAETTKVYVGDREVAKTVEKQRSANGYSFAPT